MATLETTELSKSYGGRRVVNDVSLKVTQGEIVGLLGPNGAGKTTSFYMVVGLISPDSGQVMLESADLTAMPMFQRARRGISYLPQEASVFRKLTVADNLMAILETVEQDRERRRHRMEQLLDEFGIGHIDARQFREVCYIIARDIGHKGHLTECFALGANHFRIWPSPFTIHVVVVMASSPMGPRA